VDFVTDLIKRLHDPPSMRNPNQPNAHRVQITSGAQDSIHKVLKRLMFLSLLFSFVKLLEVMLDSSKLWQP